MSVSSERVGRRHRLSAIVAIAAALVLVVPPSALPAQTTPARPVEERVDAGRLMSDLSVLAADSMEGRAVGTAGSERARRYLVRRFAEVGLRRFTDSYQQPFAASRAAAAARRGVNLVGYVRGTRTPDRWIVVTAHYDHLGVRDGTVYNGADDNASGTAALLAIAEALRARPPENSVIIAALDAEETGLLGARAFVDRPPVDRAKIEIDINLDMVSRNAEGELWAAGTYHYPALLPIVRAAAEDAAVELRLGHDRPGIPNHDDWTTSSDHAPFHAAGIPFLYFGVEDHADYHHPTDDASRVDLDFYAAAVTTVLDVLRRVDRWLAEGHTVRRGMAPAGSAVRTRLRVLGSSLPLVRR